MLLNPGADSDIQMLIFDNDELMIKRCGSCCVAKVIVH